MYCWHYFTCEVTKRICIYFYGSTTWTIYKKLKTFVGGDFIEQGHSTPTSIKKTPYHFRKFPILCHFSVRVSICDCQYFQQSELYGGGLEKAKQQKEEKRRQDRPQSKSGTCLKYPSAPTQSNARRFQEKDDVWLLTNSVRALKDVWNDPVLKSGCTLFLMAFFEGGKRGCCWINWDSRILLKDLRNARLIVCGIRWFLANLGKWVFSWY